MEDIILHLLTHSAPEVERFEFAIPKASPRYRHDKYRLAVPRQKITPLPLKKGTQTRNIA